MMRSLIAVGGEGRKELMAGLDIVANAVTVTLGAKGRNVIIKNIYGETQATKDGVTVARSIYLVDDFKSIGAMMVQEVCINTVDQAGDGTTTAALLTQAIMKAGIKYIDSGCNPMDVKRGIDKAVLEVIRILKESLSKPADTEDILLRIATISGNNEAEIGKYIMEAVKLVGRKGHITIGKNTGHGTEVKLEKGVKLASGFASYRFVTDEQKMKYEAENAYVLVTDMKIKEFKHILPLMEQIAQSGRPLVIVADSLDPSVMTSLIHNKSRGIFNVCVVRPPEYGDARKLAMEDLAVATGAIFMNEEAGFKIENVDVAYLGQVQSVEVDKDSALFVDGSGKKNEIDARIAQLEGMLKEEDKEISDHDKTKIKTRVSNLKDGVAVIKVGGVTDPEVKEKKDRVDDALHAMRSADEEGYVPGGGVAFLECAKRIEDMASENADEKVGIKIIYQALLQPFNKILSNGGVDPARYQYRIMDGDKFGNGYNIKNDKMEDFYETGVLDPTKVLRISLENAASIAGIFLTTECVIEQKFEKEQKD